MLRIASVSQCTKKPAVPQDGGLPSSAQQVFRVLEQDGEGAGLVVRSASNDALGDDLGGHAANAGAGQADGTGRARG